MFGCYSAQKKMFVPIKFWFRQKNWTKICLEVEQIFDDCIATKSSFVLTKFVFSVFVNFLFHFGSASLFRKGKLISRTILEKVL